MRPAENGLGAILESQQEVQTLAEAADASGRLFALGAEQGGDDAEAMAGYSALLLKFSEDLQAVSEKPQSAGTPYAYHLDEAFTRDFLPVVLHIAKEQHPRPEVREAAGEMIRSYASHIFDIAMMPPLDTAPETDER